MRQPEAAAAERGQPAESRQQSPEQPGRDRAEEQDEREAGRPTQQIALSARSAAPRPR